MFLLVRFQISFMPAPIRGDRRHGKLNLDRGIVCGRAKGPNGFRRIEEQNSDTAGLAQRVGGLPTANERGWGPHARSFPESPTTDGYGSSETFSGRHAIAVCDTCRIDIGPDYIIQIVQIVWSCLGGSGKVNIGELPGAFNEPVTVL